MEEDLMRETHRLSIMMSACNASIIEQARRVVPILKDAKQEASAKEMERVLFEYDAIMEESVQFALNNVAFLISTINERKR